MLLQQLELLAEQLPLLVQQLQRAVAQTAAGTQPLLASDGQGLTSGLTVPKPDAAISQRTLALVLALQQQQQQQQQQQPPSESLLERYLAQAEAEIAAERDADAILPMHALEFVIVDEVDACLTKDEGRTQYESFASAAAATTTSTTSGGGGGGGLMDRRAATEYILQYTRRHAPRSCRGLFVGATLPPDIVESPWVRDPSLIVSAQAGQVVESLRHRYLVAEPGRELLLLSRMLRRDAMQAERAAGLEGPGAWTPRVLLYTENDGEAQKVASALRRTVWEHHRVTALLPRGEQPLRVMESFRDGASTCLVATPQTERGLDFPDVSHVVMMGAPKNAVSYMHRAGRAGRMRARQLHQEQDTKPFPPGVVTVFIAPGEEAHLLQMARELGVEMEAMPEPGKGEDVGFDAQKRLIRSLEDTFYLYDYDDAPPGEDGSPP